MPRPRLLFLVHVEESFRAFLPDSLVREMVRACESGDYDRVIFLTSGIDDQEPIRELRPYVKEQWVWSWGYDEARFRAAPEERRWLIPAGASVHEWTWVPPEIRNREQWMIYEVHVGGGVDGECLTSWREVLSSLGIGSYRAEALIYGFHSVKP